MAMSVLGNGLSDAGRNEDALSVKEAELAMKGRIGASANSILVAQSNLSNSYQMLGRLDEALRLRQDVYSERLKLSGEEHEKTLQAADNYAMLLLDLRRFKEAKALLRRILPVARRAIGSSHITTLRMRWLYASTLYKNTGVNILVTQSNLANTYEALGRNEEALQMRRDVYSRHSELYGEQSIETLGVAYNYAATLNDLEHFEEAKSLLRKLMPVTRRALGESHELMLMMRWTYAKALYRDTNATLDDLRDAATRLEELAPNTRRVLGGDNPITKGVVRSLQEARAALDARETPSPCQCSVS